MKLLIQNGRVVDPATGFDAQADLAIADGRVVQRGSVRDFTADQTLNAQGHIVCPGLVDLAVRLREPGHEHEGMLESEMAAAAAAGVTSLVCPPDTDPVLDEPGLVQMLRFRAKQLRLSNVYPLGALTQGLQGERLTEMGQLSDAGCVGFSQADVALRNTQVLQRALQYATTFGYTTWLRPQDAAWEGGVAASGPVAMRLGLSGIPVAAETIALHTIFELIRGNPTRVHLCRLSSAAGVELVRQAKRDGLQVTCDVSINSLHLCDNDIGHFDARLRLSPPVRQERDRQALRAGLLDGTIDALVSDHTPLEADVKTLPFAAAEPGATGVELLLSLALKWGQEDRVPLTQVLKVLTQTPASIIGPQCANSARLDPDSLADVCVFDPDAHWQVLESTLRSQGKHTPFSHHEMPGQVRWTVVQGRVVYDKDQA